MRLRTFLLTFLVMAAVVVAALFFVKKPPSRIAVTLPAYHIDPESGMLTFQEDGYKGLRKTPLPDAVLDRLVGAILFAFRVGAMREISSNDLDHAHLLMRPDKKEISFESLDGILLHTQEFAPYSPDAYQKRNIFSGPDGVVRVLPCTMLGHSASLTNIRGMKVRDCTIYAPELGEVLTALYIVGVDHVPPKILGAYARNVRVVHGHKVLFGITRDSREPH